MTPKYSSPIRMTWSVPTDPSLASAQLAKLREGRVLFVEAEVDEAGAKALCAAIGEARGVSLSAMGAPGALEAFAACCESAAKVEAVALFEMGGEEAIAGLKGKFKALSVALWSTDEGLSRFGDALALAARLGLKISIPNPHAPTAHLSRTTRNAVAEAWERAEVKPAATVHDLFLSEAMGIDPWRNYTGCAASSALGNLRADGVVTACRTMPTALGDLNRSGVKEIWSDEAATALREKLAKAPAACHSCALAAGCKGGCPGLADETGRDGSCEGLRGGESS